MSKQYYTEFSVRTNEMRSRSSQRKKADTGSPSRYWFSSVSVYVSVMQNGKPNTSDLKAKSDLRVPQSAIASQKKKTRPNARH